MIQRFLGARSRLIWGREATQRATPIPATRRPSPPATRFMFAPSIVGIDGIAGMDGIDRVDLAPARERALARAAIRASERQAIRAVPAIIRADGVASRAGRRLRVLSAAKRHPRICCCMGSNRP